MRLRHIRTSTVATEAVSTHWNAQASCSLPPRKRTIEKMLCSFHQVALPSVRKACENTGIQWKKACQLSVPKASHDTTAIDTVVAAALKNPRQCEVAISTSGNSRPYCGL